MIARTYKKLADEHNMTVSNGVAYGFIHGYTTTLSEGAGYKLIQLTTTFPEAQKQVDFMNYIQAQDLKSKYRVLNMTYTNNILTIVFHDNPGTMKRISAFIDYFFPLLEQYGATKGDICPQCGCSITSGTWKLVGETAFYLHESCAEKYRRMIEEEQTLQKQEDTGNYLSGVLGALLGAGVGAILWAVILAFGYIASVVGFVIGWLAEKGYTLLNGKKGKGKLFILLFATLFGVLAGTLGGQIISIIQAGYTLSAVPTMLAFILATPHALSGLAGNIVIGILFGFLGIFSIIRRTSKEVKTVKVIDLN